MGRNGSFSSKFDLQDFNCNGPSFLEKRLGILNLTSDRRKVLQTVPFRIFTNNIMTNIFLRLVCVRKFISFKRLVMEVDLTWNPIGNALRRKVNTVLNRL